MLWIAQRLSAAVLALCVVVHLATMVVAIRGGLSAADFVRVMAVQRVTADGLRRLAPTVISLARAEGLQAHAESIEVRL